MNVFKYVLENMKQPFIDSSLEDEDTFVITDKDSGYSIYRYIHPESLHIQISLEFSKNNHISISDVDDTQEEITTETVEIFEELYKHIG